MAWDDSLFGREQVLCLQRIIQELVTALLIVEHVLPIPGHSKVVNLRIDPVSLLERIFVAREARHVGLPIQRNALREFRPHKLDDGWIQIREIDEIV